MDEKQIRSFKERMVSGSLSDRWRAVHDILGKDLTQILEFFAVRVIVEKNKGLQEKFLKNITEFGEGINMFFRMHLNNNYKKIKELRELREQLIEVYSKIPKDNFIGKRNLVRAIADVETRING